MTGLCECGCGQTTDIATYTRPSCRWVKGEPKPYVRGHHNHVRANRDNYLKDDETGCWNWQGVVNNWGYGVTRVHGKTRPAHRFHYERVNGSVDAALQIDHLCRNKRCVNPEHLEAVTPRENYRRGPNIKLGMDNAREMRRLRAEGWTHTQLMEKFGTAASQTHYVLTGELWAE